MASTDTLLALYSASGLCELAGVIVTFVDLRAKAQIAREVEGPLPPSTNPQQARLRNRDGSTRMASYEQSQRVTMAFIESLRGPWLLVGAILLLVGIIIGTIGNALSAIS